MVGLGVVLPPEARGRGAAYRLSPDLQAARAFLQTRLPELRRFFGRRPFLQNADYRNLFGVTRIRASRELAGLVERGFLVLEGRGRGARYVRGEGLPTEPEK